MLRMATGFSEAGLASRQFSEDDLADLCDALYRVSTKYRFFGLQIGLKMHEIRGIAAKHSDSVDCLLEILSARLNQESALTCADIVKALKSPSVGEHNLASEFRKLFENIIHEEQVEEDKKCSKAAESEIPLEMDEKQNERIKRTEKIKSYNESKGIGSQKAAKSAEVEREVYIRDEPKSKDKKKRAVKGESEHPEPDQYKAYERKQMKGKQKEKIPFSKVVVGPRDGAKCDEKRKKLVKKSEKGAHEIMSTDSEDESSDEKEILLSMSQKTRKVQESIAYSGVKNQPQSAKIKFVPRKKGKVPVKEGSTKKQHSTKTAVAVKSDEDTPFHKSKKKLVAKETESEEESLSESTSHECQTNILDHREKMTTKSPTDTEEMFHDSDEKVKDKHKKQMPHKSKVATARSSPHSERQVGKEQYKQKKGFNVKEQGDSGLQAKFSRGKLQKPHYQLKERARVKETDSRMKAKRLVAHCSEQDSDESQTHCENEESDSGNDSSEDGEDSEEKSSDEEEKTEEFFTAPSEEKGTKKKCVFQEEDDSKFGKKVVSEPLVDPSKYGSSVRSFGETCTRKKKGKIESEATSLKHDSPGDDEQSDPGHGSRDQEEHDIQKKKRNTKRQSTTAFGSSSPSTSQEEKKKQPISKKQGHRKKHVRKMKKKRERMKRAKKKTATDDSSPECDMATNQYKGEIKQLVKIFERFFGKLCQAVFDPVDTAVELQMKGLVSKEMMRDMMLSPESQQSKIIHFFDSLDEMIKSRPDCLFVIIEVMLKNEALQETARDILREAGIHKFYYFVCSAHFLGIKPLFLAGRVCPFETAGKFPSPVPPSGTSVPSTAEGIW